MSSFTSHHFLGRRVSLARALYDGIGIRRAAGAVAKLAVLMMRSLVMMSLMRSDIPPSYSPSEGDQNRKE